MKKCPVCNISYEDSNIKCPRCGLYLIKDVVSDFNRISGVSEDTNKRDTNTGLRRRAVIGRVVDTPFGSSKTTEENGYDSGNANGFERGRDIHNGGNQSIDSATIIHRRSAFRVFMRGLLPTGRVLLPIIFILAAIIIIIINWATIKPVLTCAITGAIIGGGLMVFMSLRRGHAFNQNSLATGAILGALVACILQYNILDVGTEISEIMSALIPILITIGGIWMMINSLRR